MMFDEVCVLAPKVEQQRRNEPSERVFAHRAEQQRKNKPSKHDFAKLFTRNQQFNKGSSNLPL